MLSLGLLVSIFADAQSAQFARNLFCSKAGAVAGIFGVYEGLGIYTTNKRLVDACQDSSSSLSYTQQSNIREIFRSQGVDSLHIADAEEVMERFGGGSLVIDDLMAITLPKNVLLIPFGERMILEEGMVRIPVYPGKNITFSREGTQAYLYHEATHCKHNDDAEKIAHRVLKSESFALLAGQAAYVKAGGGRKPLSIGIGLFTGVLSYLTAPYIDAYRSRQREKRCDLSIPTSRLMRAAADDLEKEEYCRTILGGATQNEESFLDTHPAVAKRIQYLREAADRLEKEGK